MGDDYLLRTRDVARMLGVDTRTVRRYVQDGLLEVTSLPGGQFRFLRADVEDMLKKAGKP